jgi:integrase/recombinase XerD
MKHLPLLNPHFQLLQDAFADWLSILGYAESSVHYLPLHLRELLHYLEENQLNHIQALDRAQVSDFFAYLATRRNMRNGQKLSPAYLAKYWQAIKMLDRYLRETGQWGLNLPPSTVQPERVLKAVMTQAETKALFAVAGEDTLGLRDKAMLALFYGCGLRRSEGIWLDVDDILLEQGLVYVRKGKNYQERYVPLSHSVSYHLRQYLELARPILLTEGMYAGMRDRNALLLSTRGRRINDRTLTIRIRKLQQQTANPKLLAKRLSLHSLRHAIATHLMEKGMKLTRIARFLGHAKLESTQIYTHLVQDEL